jgi:acetoin utilization protein AcuC
MTDRSILIHHPDFAEYDFGPGHPLRPERLQTGLGLLQACGVYDPLTDSPAVVPATRTELALVHDDVFIDAVIGAGSGDAPPAVYAHFGLHSRDNPPFPCMHEASAFVTGGSVGAARAIMRGEALHAFNPAGGLHHALKARASGFCIYNDPAVAAAVLAREFGARVFYVDFDCHHGDGVQWLFYDDPGVFTLSFHETGTYLFPGTGAPDEIGEGAGERTSANVPFAPYTEDASWQEAVEGLLPDLVERFRPDVLISNHGCDTHDWDPLTHLSLTTASLVWQARLTHELAHSACEGRWLALGSGGYEWRRVVPRSWAILWAEMAQRPLDDVLPEAWVREWEIAEGAPMPRTISDGPGTVRRIPRRAEIEALNRESVRLARSFAGLPN